MLNVDEVISPNAKVIKTKELELDFGVIKSSLYENPIPLMLSW